MKRYLGHWSALGLLGFVSCWVNYHLVFDHGPHDHAVVEQGQHDHGHGHDHGHDHGHGHRHKQLPKPQMQPSSPKLPQHGSHEHELSSVKARHNQREMQVAVTLSKEPLLFTIFWLSAGHERVEVPPPKQSPNAQPQPRGPPATNLV